MSKKPKNLNVLIKIYCLIDPITEELRYIGKTVESLNSRLGKHLTDLRTNPHKSNWIKSLLKQGKIPEISLLEECPWKVSQEREKYWIELYKENTKLLNMTNGGEGNLGNKKPLETRKKLSTSLRQTLGYKVYQYDLNGNFIKEWKDIVEASSYLVLRRENISQVCRLKKKSHGGFIWSKLPPNIIDFSVYKKTQRKSKIFENNSFVKKSKAVKAINLNTREVLIFKSMREASEFTRINKCSICEECKLRRKAKGNYKFEYYNE